MWDLRRARGNRLVDTHAAKRIGHVRDVRVRTRDEHGVLRSQVGGDRSVCLDVPCSEGKLEPVRWVMRAALLAGDRRADVAVPDVAFSDELAWLHCPEPALRRPDG